MPFLRVLALRPGVTGPEYTAGIQAFFDFDGYVCCMRALGVGSRSAWIRRRS